MSFWTRAHRTYRFSYPAPFADLFLCRDLWLASSSSLTATSQGIPTFNPNGMPTVLSLSPMAVCSRLAPASSTFKNLWTSFQIQYGSGAAEGFLGSDVVQMAGLSIKSQTFGKPPF